MDCRGVSRRLSSFIDDALSPAIKQAMSDHLASCPKCNQKLEDIRTIVGVANNLPTLKASEGFEQRVAQAALAGAGSVLSVGSFKYKLFMAGAAFAVTTTAIFFAFGPTTISEVQTMTEIHGQASPEIYTVNDFYENPGLKVDKFPVPEEALRRDFAGVDTQMLTDSISRIDEFVTPELEKVIENVNVRY